MSHILTSTAALGILRARFHAAHQDYIHIFDTAYSPLDDARAAAYFSDLANQAQGALKPWELNKSDCDKYARTVAWLALMGHAEYSSVRSGVTVGVICYVSNAKGRHAANVLLTARMEGKERIYSVRVFEPQDGSELHLTQSERASVYRIML